MSENKQEFENFILLSYENGGRISGYLILKFEKTTRALEKLIVQRSLKEI